MRTILSEVVVRERGWLAGVVAGLLGDALLVYRGFWAYLAPVPGVKTNISVIRLGSDVTQVTVPGEMMTRLWAQVEQTIVKLTGVWNSPGK